MSRSLALALRPLRIATAIALVVLATLAAGSVVAGPRLVRVRLGRGLTAQRLVDAGLDVISVGDGACRLLTTDRKSVV